MFLVLHIKKKNHSKIRSITTNSIQPSKPSWWNGAKNQPICRCVTRFFTICFGPDIAENVEHKVSLFFGTTILSPPPSLFWTPQGGCQMQKNRQ
jgi:hypothetical protein